MILISSDIEYLIITISLVFLFLTGIKKRQYANCDISGFVRGESVGCQLTIIFHSQYKE